MKFMNSFLGRLLRFLLGALLLWIGYKMNSTAGRVIALAGIIPLLTAMFDLCLISPIFGYPLIGRKARTKLTNHQ